MKSTTKTIILDYQLAYQRACQGQNNVPSVADFQLWLQTASHYLQLSKQYEVVIRLVDNDEISALNSTYRQKNQPTNVLSFPFDNEHQLPLDDELLGDIVIAVDVITDEANQQNKPILSHWAHISIHGFLHLLGYDHIDPAEAEEMEGIEIAILSELDIINPYE